MAVIQAPLVDREDDWDRISNTPAWMLVFFNNMLCGCAGFAVVLPSLWPFMRGMGASTTIFAFAVAMYSVGEGFGGKAIGLVCDRLPDSPKEILLGGMVIGCASAVVYGFAPLFGPNVGPLVVVAARFFQGFDNGGRQTIEQSFLGTHVPSRHMATASSRLSSFALTGIMLGPTLGGPLQAISFDMPGVGLHVDGTNAPGFLLAFLCMVNIAITVRYFHPGDIVARSAARAQVHADPAAIERPTNTLAPPSKFGLWTCYTVFFTNSVSVACLETITPVVLQRLYGWGPCLNPDCPLEPQRTYVNMMLSAGGVLSLACALLMAFYLGARMHGREALSIALGLMAPVLTNLSSVDWFGSLPAWRFVVAYTSGCFFTGFLRGPCYSLFSQIIGPHPKASYMGTSFLVGATPRVIGPFVFLILLDAPPSVHDVDYDDVYTGPAPRTWLLYGAVAALNACALALVLLGRSSGILRPHPATQEGLAKPLLDEEGCVRRRSHRFATPASPTGRCTTIAGGA